MSKAIAVLALLGALLGISVYAIKQRDFRMLTEDRLNAAVQAVQYADNELRALAKADARSAQQKRTALESVRTKTIPLKEAPRAVPDPCRSPELDRLRDEAVERANAEIAAAG